MLHRAPPISTSRARTSRPPDTGTFPSAAATNQSATFASITSPLLYPFDSAYGVYAGNCTAANPQSLVPAVSPAFAKNPSGLDPGQLLYPVTVRQPALNVQAIQGSGTANIISGKSITAQPTSGTCAGQLKFKLLSYTGTGASDTNRGWASKSATTGNFDPGLPYGTYDVCVDNGSGGSPRRSKAGSVIVNLNSAAGSTPNKIVDLSIAAQYTAGVLCPP
ncbi:MAG: hypothetical protein M3O90_06880 [Actinomycetota bacterium]|nr:hypothetical protein [Actinomycetota bacterium]